MIKRVIATGAVGLGLVGGVGSVVHNDDGSSTVTVDDRGRKSTVTIAADGGQRYSCPKGVEAQLDPVTVRMGRIKLTLDRVRRQEKAIERAYPNSTAPERVIKRYDKLFERDRRLVTAYNDAVDEHAGILRSDCTAA